MYVFPIPIRVKPLSSNARTIFIRLDDVLQRISTPLRCGWSPAPVRPLLFSYATDRNAEFKTNGMPACFRALSNCNINCWSISCNEQGGTQRLNSLSLKNFAVIIAFVFLVMFASLATFLQSRIVRRIHGTFNIRVGIFMLAKLGLHNDGRFFGRI